MRKSMTELYEEWKNNSEAQEVYEELSEAWGRVLREDKMRR